MNLQTKYNPDAVPAQTLDSTETHALPRWNLGDVMPARSGRIFQAEILDRLESLIVEFERERSELNESISQERFLQLLEEFERIERLRSRLGSYAYMYFSEDTRSQDARTFKSRTEEIEADAANRILFFELWWKSLSDSKIDSLISVATGYQYFLKKLIQTRPYTLSEPVEQAINLKDVTGRSALLQIYHQVRDSFTYDVEIEGVTKKLTDELVRDLFHSNKRAERKAAYSASLSRFHQNSDLLGEIYKALVRDWLNEGIKLRRYGTSISIRNVANDVPDEAVSALLEVCKENAVLFQSFFKLKAKLLGIRDYSRIDLYAPLPTIEQRKYTWEEGMNLVLSTFATFNEEFASYAKNIFEQNHFDAQIREGKLGGAYCMSVSPDITPYILLSYTGNPRSVATMAHELGHGIHSQLSARRNKNNQLTFEAPLPLAETASVFGELLLMDRLLAESDAESRKSLLVEMLNDAYATILRQSFFVLFEMESHEAIGSGVNVDELCSKYLSNLKTQFSDSMDVPEEFAYEWLSIPHIYQSPFYCYSYSWGNILVMALYKQYREEGAKAFAPRYMKILAYGGSESPEKILNEAGFDIRSKSFWQSGFDELSRSLGELQKLV
ncbi:MAG TPA: M3 family oligoendopeptidase [Nitrososphaerales archaeon]|nr:M3 family oligoendopeptidase [Nitrososphaerales archaeon]